MSKLWIVASLSLLAGFGIGYGTHSATAQPANLYEIEAAGQGTSSFQKIRVFKLNKQTGQSWVLDVNEDHWTSLR
jgi:hypothetical protein